MKKTIKKVLSIVLSVFLLVTVIPMNVFAMSTECTCGNEYDDNGFCLNTECNSYQPAVETTDKYDIDNDSVLDIVYEISNAGQLYWFAEQVNSGNNGINGILTKNIVVNTGDLKNYDGESVNDWRVWTPIAYPNEDRAGYDYLGTFDGNYYEISGLYYNDETRQGVGLFGVVEGVIVNVSIKNSYFHAKKEVGGICGALQGDVEENNKIEYCTSDATIVSEEGYAGGICGISAHTIKCCYNTGNVSSVEYPAEYTGGVVGNICYAGSVEDCSNSGEIIGYYYTGGICGFNDKLNIIECYNHGDVTGYFVGTGGICGVNNAETIRCFNTGDILGDEGVGGICGSQGNPISDCYNTGEVTCATGYAGGISGMTTSTITNCYNIGAVVGMSEGVGCLVGAICGDAAPESMVNCYYLSDCAVDGAGVTQNGIGALDLGATTEDGTGTISKTADKFENGEVCYLLDGERAGTKDYVWAQSIGYDKYPVIGGEQVLYKESDDKYFNLDYSLLQISHQPTVEEPYVELYEDFKAQYQWYNVEKFLTEITDVNAEKFVSYGDSESSYNSETGWTAIGYNDMGPHEFAYLTVKLEAGDTVFVELSDDKANYVRLFNPETSEIVAELINSGQTAYSLTVETSGEYVLYVTHESNTVTLKAYIGEINYNKIEGATDASYSSTEPGIYVCKVTFADGSTELSKEFEITSFTGVKDDYFYKNDVRLNAYQLVEHNGDFYYISNYHKIVKDKTIYLSAQRVEGFTYADGTPIKAGYYTFDADGKMVMLNGVVGDYLYKDNIRYDAYQLVEYEGDFYYISNYNKIVRDKTIYLSAERVEGLTNSNGTPFKAGYYTFDADGKMIMHSGLVGDYFYEDGIRLDAYQLVEYEGDFYYISNYNKIVRDKTIYLSAQRVEGFNSADGTPLKAGYYTFDADGKLIK